MNISNAIVVGGGIGGLAAATALARKRVAVTLIERAPAFEDPILEAGRNVAGVAALALAAEVDVSLLDRGPPNPTEFLCCDLVTGSIVDQCLSGFSAHNNFLPIITEMCCCTFAVPRDRGRRRAGNGRTD